MELAQIVSTIFTPPSTKQNDQEPEKIINCKPLNKICVNLDLVCQISTGNGESNGLNLITN